MAQWQLNIDFSDFWTKYPKELSTKKLCKNVVTVLNKTKTEVKILFPDYLEDLEEIINKFDDLAKEEDPSIDDFDHILEELYDLGDTKLDSKIFNGKKLAWIKTRF